MGLFDFVKKPVSDLYIARPESEVGLIYRHPHQSVPNGAKLTVRADETCVFFREGRCDGELAAGTYRLDTANIPFLGQLLVSPATGGNYYLTELFFVRRTEHLHQTGPRVLGTFSDTTSRQLVRLEFYARFSLRVTGAARLITTLAGMQSAADVQVAAFLDGRVASLLAQVAGNLMESQPALRIASNQYSEELGQQVTTRAKEGFAADGIEIARFLELQLRMDRASEEALREYGRRLAELNVQREGAELALKPGYAQYHIIQGQRAMMEGAGLGLADGNAVLPMLGVGGGLSPAMAPVVSLPVASSPAVAPASPRPASSLSARFYLRTAGGIEGPYNARQVVLRAVASRFDVSTALVRRQGEEDWQAAEEFDELAAEFGRRTKVMPTAVSRGASGAELFENAFKVAVVDQELTTEEVEMLAALARATDLAPDDSEARRYVVLRANAIGCRVPPAPPAEAKAAATAAPAPPPLRTATVYIYSNGIEQVPGLTPAAVAQRVRAVPDGVHMVWSRGMQEWAEAKAVPEIKALLGDAP